MAASQRLCRKRTGRTNALIAKRHRYREVESELVGAVPLPLSLPDPDDAMFLEVASAGGAEYVVTGNIRHFPTDARQGITVVSPRDFIEIVIGEQ